MKHMRQQLREIPMGRRVVGFQDAVNDLGTHRICGVQVTYSRQAVYQVLIGKSLSKNLMKRIVLFRPDLLLLSFVSDEAKDLAQKLGWDEARTRKTTTLGRDEAEKNFGSRVGKGGETHLPAGFEGARQIAKTGAMA